MAQEGTNEPTEENMEFRNRSTCIRSLNLRQRWQCGIVRSFQYIILGQMDIHLGQKKNESLPLVHTILKSISSAHLNV